MEWKQRHLYDPTRHSMSTCVGNSLIAFGVLQLLTGLSCIGICIWSILEASLDSLDRCLHNEYYYDDDYNYYYYWYDSCLEVVFTLSSQGIWAGTFATIAGCLSIDFGVNPDKKLGSATTGMNTFATILSFFMIGLEACGIVFSYDFTLITLHCALVGLASGLFIFGLVLSILSCAGKGCCCGQTQVLYTPNRDTVAPIVGVGRDNPAFFDQYQNPQNLGITPLQRQPTQILPPTHLYTVVEQARPQTASMLAANPPNLYNPEAPLLRENTIVTGPVQHTTNQQLVNAEELHVKGIASSEPIHLQPPLLQSNIYPNIVQDEGLEGRFQFQEALVPEPITQPPETQTLDHGQNKPTVPIENEIIKDEDPLNPDMQEDEKQEEIQPPTFQPIPKEKKKKSKKKKSETIDPPTDEAHEQLGLAGDSSVKEDSNIEEDEVRSTENSQDVEAGPQEPSVAFQKTNLKEKIVKDEPEYVKIEDEEENDYEDNK